MDAQEKAILDEWQKNPVVARIVRLAVADERARTLLEAHAACECDICAAAIEALTNAPQPRRSDKS